MMRAASFDVSKISFEYPNNDEKFQKQRGAPFEVGGKDEPSPYRRRVRKPQSLLLQ